MAVDDGRFAGFVSGTLDAGDGLLPGAAGRDRPARRARGRGQGLSRRLAEAAVAWLRERGAGWTVQMRVCSQDTEAIAFWSSLGFEPDMTVMSLYAE